MSLANQMEKNSDATSTFTSANGAQNEKCCYYINLHLRFSTTRKYLRPSGI